MAIHQQPLRDDIEADHQQHPEEVPASEVELRSNSEIGAAAEAQRAASGDAAGASDISDVDALVRHALRTPAVALPHRAEMEQRFGRDLSEVRAHIGPEVAVAASRLGVQAFALGNDIAFAETDPSAAVVAHELTHVVQQRTRGAGDVAGDEREADRAEAQVAAGQSPGLEADPGEAGPTQRSPMAASTAVRFKKVEHDTIPATALSETGRLAEESKAGGPLDDAHVKKAIAFNHKKLNEEQRTQIRAFLAGGPVLPGDFTAADIAAIHRIQLGAGVPEAQADGMIGDTTMSILLHAGFAFQFEDTLKAKASDVQLIFYPGEFEDVEEWKAKKQAALKLDPDSPYRALGQQLGEPEGTGRLYVKWKGNLVAKMDVRGGPPVSLKDGSHSADPTKAGTYALGAGKPHRTNAWLYSQIRWGAKLREHGGEVEFLDPGETKWKVATGSNPGIQDALPKSAFYQGGKLLPEWTKNDFGPMSWNLTGSPGLYIHTTPADEAVILQGKQPSLSASHGCMHVNPSERDMLMAHGFLQGGVTLIVKKYDVHLLPEQMRDMMEDSAAP